ncbi:major facilitator superfamily domain-containing protein 12-like [Actinia tenebrosa]|uniref:Major facilitator superfamily domain-containing protein 12-like n=1 Tax=Actinia tenebrosa TaxID=6105 RepID=A0A6P8I1Q3_ACTTE|nr:major facilitator superfamily domain-containing protein 12-like [Actinia tenebrosa]
MEIPESIPKEAEDTTSSDERNTSPIRCKRKHLFTTWIHRSTPYVLQELTFTAWQSYSFLFFRLVVGMNASGFGWIYLVSQLTKVVVLSNGCSQRSTASTSGAARKCTLRCCRGLKNATHILASIGILFFWPLIFAPCLTCSEDVSETFVIFAYGFPILVFSCCWAALELTKNSPNFDFSLRSELQSPEKRFMSLLRSFTHKSTLGLLLHLVTWIVLTNGKGEHISPASQGAFANQTLFILIVGFCATVLYYITSYKTSKRIRKESDKNNEVEQRENHAEESRPTSTSAQSSIDQDRVGQWKLHFQDMNYMRSVFVYILSSNASVVTMLLLPVYLIESIHCNKLAVAYFSAVVFGGWSLALVILEKLLSIFGCKVLFCASSIMMFGSSVWFYTQSSSLNYLLYFPALTFGYSACVMMITSQTMFFTSSSYPSLYLIGADDFTKTLNEVFNGFVVFAIMQTFPQGHRSQSSQESGEFLRLVIFLVPAIQSAVSFVQVFFYAHIPNENCQKIQYNKTLQQRLALQDSSRNVVIKPEDLEILEDLPSTKL